MNSSVIKTAGNVCMVLSLGGFLFLGYPLLKVYLVSPPYVSAEKPSEQFSLSIPRRKAQSRVIEHVDPWNKAAYTAALKNGVAHAAPSGLPGEEKTVFLFAHSSGPPWEQLYNNTVFLRLGELKSGDEVILERKKRRFLYKVVDKKEVLPNEVQYLEKLDKDQLILQTCTPIGTSLKRLLIFAVPVGK
jgi:sortase A